MIKIDKGVPVPKRSDANIKLPWDQMKIGDSFLIPAGIQQPRIGSMISKASKRLGWKFIQRKTEEGIRVWRVKNGD